MRSYKPLLKNGFKTMFKSKKGFIFIMILTFLLYLVVSASLTTIKKMSSDFNSVVGNNEKFNSSYNKYLLLKNGNNDVFYPIMDLINPSLYTKKYNYKDKASKDVSIKTNAFNFNDVPFIRDTINGNGNDNKIFQLMYPFLTQIKNVRQKRSGIIQWYNFNDLHSGEKFYLIPKSKDNDKYQFNSFSASVAALDNANYGVKNIHAVRASDGRVGIRPQENDTFNFTFKLNLDNIQFRFSLPTYDGGGVLHIMVMILPQIILTLSLKILKNTQQVNHETLNTGVIMITWFSISENLNKTK